MGGGIDPTDIVAIVLLGLYSLRRMEVRTTDPRAFPGIIATDFDAWKGRALGARGLAVHACFLKFALNSAWFFGFRSHVSQRVLRSGGTLFFVAWVIALVVAWRLSSRTNAEATRLGIVIGRRLVDPPPA